MERGGYLYPWPSARFSYIAPLQLIYSSLTAGFGVKLQGARCTNLTFSRCEVYKSDILTYSRFTRTPIPDEGLRVLRVVPEGSRLRSCASEWSVATFGHPKVVLSKLRRS